MPCHGLAQSTDSPWYGGWLATMNEEYGMGESAILFTGTENVTTQRLAIVAAWLFYSCRCARKIERLGDIARRHGRREFPRQNLSRVVVKHRTNRHAAVRGNPY